MHQTKTYRVESNTAPLTRFVMTGITGLNQSQDASENLEQSSTVILSLPACVVDEALPDVVTAHHRR